MPSKASTEAAGRVTPDMSIAAYRVNPDGANHVLTPIPLNAGPGVFLSPSQALKPMRQDKLLTGGT